MNATVARHRLGFSVARIVLLALALVVIQTSFGSGSVITRAQSAPPATQASESAPPDGSADAARQEGARLRFETQRLGERVDRLSASLGGDAALEHAIAAQTALLQRISERLDRVLPKPSDAAGSTKGPGAVGSAPREMCCDDEARLQATLTDLEWRYQLLIEQFAVAQQARALAVAAAEASRAELAEVSARLQQKQLLALEAQSRAEKAEKLAAATDEARARAETDNERLTVTLSTAEAQRSQAQQQAAVLERRLAAAEARLAEVAGNAIADGADPADEPGDAARDASGDQDDAAAGAAGELGSTPAGGAEQPVRPVLYRVRPDDTLSLISVRVYGDGAAWGRIFDANRDVLETPDSLAPGMTLIIP